MEIEFNPVEHPEWKITNRLQFTAVETGVYAINGKLVRVPKGQTVTVDDWDGALKVSIDPANSTTTAK